MADDIVIRADGLGKKYVIGHAAERERYVALRDVMARGARAAWRKTADVLRGRALIGGDTTEEFWALRDVSFEVKRGEVLGIIGRNGAGKSTLLKVLSRITEPSEGRVTIRGRVASLLEVGTGFHPELTGRENIYLNGAILGMTRAESRSKFDQIVEFAGVEKFLDTPVKRYSSGMYVRLAFAVAAHLEPEILVIDEVLAVGDAEFQRKCLGKMSEVAGGGRTVLFVSHNMSAVEAFCPRCLYFSSGKLMIDATTSEAINLYLSRRQSRELNNTKIQDGLIMERASVSPHSLRSGDPMEITFALAAQMPGVIYECAVLIYTAKGIRVAIVDIRDSGELPLKFERGRFAFGVNVAALPIVDGEFSIGLYLVTDRFSGNLYDLVDFSVAERPSANGVPAYPSEVRGIVALTATASVVVDPPGLLLQ